MFVILEVSKQWIFFIFPSSLYSNIRSRILSLFINSLSEPHVSEHVDPSIGRKVTVGDDVGPDDENDDDDNDEGGDDVATMGDDAVETIVGGKERMGVRNKLGGSVGKTVVLLVAWVGIVLWLLFNLTLSSVGNE